MCQTAAMTNSWNNSWNPPCSKLVAASVEVHAGIGNSVAGPRRRWCWRGRRISILVAAIWFGVYLLVTGIAQVVFAFSLHVSAGQPSPVVHQRGGVIDLGRAGVSSFRLGTQSCCWPSGSASGSSSAASPQRFRRSATRTLPGRGWSIFVGVISLLAGIVVLGVAVRLDRHPGVGGRRLAGGDRRVRDRVVVRDSQGVEDAPRLKHRARDLPVAPVDLIYYTAS